MNALDPMDVSYTVRRLPPAVRMMMEKQGPKAIVAGGFLRACVANEEANDVDVFLPSKTLAKRLAEELAAGEKIISTENAYTVRGLQYPVQFIHRWTYADPAAALRAFDFTIARAAVWSEPGPDGKPRWAGMCDPRFYVDLAAKRLVYCSPKKHEAPGGSMLRVLKFYQRGYRIPLESLGACMARMTAGADMALGLTRSSAQEEAMAKMLTSLLCEVDPPADQRRAYEPEHEGHEDLAAV